MILKLGALGSNSPASGAAISEAEKKIHQTFDLLNDLLGKGNSYLVGDSLSIADLLIFAETTNAEIYKIDLAPWKNVKAWYDRLLSNEAVAGVHQKFKEALPKFVGFLDAVIVI